MERLHGKAGRRIVQTDFIGSLGDPELDEVTTPYLERIETATRIEKDIEIIDNELNALSAEYAETCEGYRAKSCVQELEAQIDAEMKKRQTVLTELGNALVAGETPAFGGGVQEQIAALRTIDSQIQETSDLRDRVNAGIEVERLEEAVQNNKKNIERKQNQIAELTAAITELEREQAELKEKKAEQEQKRGDRSLLVLSESSPNQ
jgi:chromosome segregation ATPase